MGYAFISYSTVNHREVDNKALVLSKNCIDVKAFDQSINPL